MKQSDKKQVFHDPTHYRWNFSRFSILVAGLILSSSFGLVVLKTLGKSNLPAVGNSAALSNLVSEERIKHYAIQKNNIKEDITIKQATDEIANAIAVDSEKQAAVAAESTEPKQSVCAYLVNWDDQSFESLKTNIDSIDKLIPEWLHLKNSDGELALDDPENQKEVLQYLESTKSEIEIFPLINNFDSDTMSWNSQIISEMLKNPISRRNNIEKILFSLAKINFLE